MKHYYKRLNYPLLLVAAIVLTLLVVRAALGQSGGGYDLSWSVIGGGGNTTVSDGSPYQIVDTIAQPVAGSDSSEGAHSLTSGFWSGSLPTNTPTPTPTPTVTNTGTLLAIHALAFDNEPTSPANPSPLLPDTMDGIIQATVGHPNKNKTAIVLADQDGEGDTRVFVVRDGEVTSIVGLPDATGILSQTLNEYDMTDGETLGGFLKWALSEYATAGTKTTFSYVGHGTFLAPAIDLSSVFTETTPSGRSAQGSTIFPLPYWIGADPNFTDAHPRGLITPHALQVALDVGTNGGANPLDVLNIVHCFAASVEEFHELSNPGGTPYAEVMLGSANYTYFAPQMAGDALAALNASDDAASMASRIMSAYDAVLEEADLSDGNPDLNHPRTMVTVQSSLVPAIKDNMDEMSWYLMNEFENQPTETKNKLATAYQNAGAYYDTTYCLPENSELAPPDALVDIGAFMPQIANQFGTGSGAGLRASQVASAVNSAVITHTAQSGVPWFTKPLTPIWTLDGPTVSGLALYADLQGIAVEKENQSYRDLSWHARFYTDTTTIEAPNDNPHPYLFVQGGHNGQTWADVFDKFWKVKSQHEGLTVQTAACLTDLPPPVREGELSVEGIVFPNQGTVHVNSPTILAAAIQSEHIAHNPLVAFQVYDQNNTQVFSNTVGAGRLVTGTHQVEAETAWTPTVAGPFTLKVTVDSDHRFEEENEHDNVMTMTDDAFIGNPFEISATTLHERQWLDSRTVELNIDSTVNPLDSLLVQIYEYLPGRDPNTQVPVMTHDLSFSSPSLPNFSFDLPTQVKPGPITLHLWGVANGELSNKPIVINFNYNPSNPQLDNNSDYFRFTAEAGDRLEISLNVTAGEAKLYVWANQWTAQMVNVTSGQTDGIVFDSAPAANYVVKVEGLAAGTEYTITSQRNGQPGRTMAAVTEPTIVQESRPIFIEPIPSPPPQISEVRTTNVRDISFTVSWLTDVATTSEVRYGTDPNDLNLTAHDERGADTSDDTHHLTLNGLQPNTTYYFDVVSGGTTDNNGGAHYSMTTGPTLGLPGSDTIYGKVLQEDGTTPASGSIVYITLEDADGAGTSDQAAPLSALVDHNGDWFTNSGNARTADLSSYFSYSASGDRVWLEAQGAADGVGCQSVDTSADSPATDMVLNVSECTILWPMSIDIGWNHISLPIEPLSPLTAEEVCNNINAQGGNAVEIDRWHNGGWDGHICGLAFNNFDLVLGSDYFIKSNSASSWTIEGQEVTQPVPLTLQVGWTSIGIPHTEAYSAESLCDEIISQGVSAGEIDRWHNGGWSGHICGLPFNDFQIERGVGYFVKSTSAGTVTPNAPASRQESAQAPILPDDIPAGAVMPVRDLLVSNLNDTSVTLSWRTDEPTTGYVLYDNGRGNPSRLPEQVALDLRGASHQKTHYVTLTGLKPETSYDLKVVSGAQSDEDTVVSITTAPTLESVPESDTVYGQVFFADGVTPARDVLVYLTLQDADGPSTLRQAQGTASSGTGDTANATLLSALTDENGYWHANLGNARLADGRLFDYSPSGDKLLLTVPSATDSTTTTLDTSQLRPAAPIILETQPEAWELYLPLIGN